MHSYIKYWQWIYILGYNEVELIEFLYIVAYGPIRHNFLFDLTNEISY